MFYFTCPIQNYIQVRSGDSVANKKQIGVTTGKHTARIRDASNIW